MSHSRKKSWVAKMMPDGSKGGSTTSSRALSMERDESPIDSPISSSSPRSLDPCTDLDSSSSPPLLSTKRWSGSFLTNRNSLQHDEAINALDRTTTNSDLKPPEMSNSKGSFGKMSFTSMMGGLSALSLTRTSTIEEVREREKERERGRSMNKNKSARSSSAVGAIDTDDSRSRSRARSQSPFTFRRFRQREPSPTPQPLPMASSDIDLSDTSPSVRPRNAFTDEGDSGDETVGEDTEDEDWSDDDLDIMDPVTEANTERNAIIEPVITIGGGLDGGGLDEDPDPLGEGVNVVVPPEPYFPTTLNNSSTPKRNPKRRKSTRHHEPLPIITSRPVFKRDRCTLTLTQGDPDAKLGNRRRKRYVVASDLSEESRYAVEWAIGTVLRDGDEMLIVNITENESKIDPAIPNAADRATKIRSQQERQGLAYILVRQANSLLQRTKLNVVVSCQAWHAKNARHMLLDVIDYHEPTMLIVGSRGLGQLKGILLGSTSHYLIEKCSVPVMVARRRLKRPPKRNAHLSKDRVHVSLAEAGIDRVADKVDNVERLRDELEREEPQPHQPDETIDEYEEDPNAEVEVEEKK